MLEVGEVKDLSVIIERHGRTLYCHKLCMVDRTRLIMVVEGRSEENLVLRIIGMDLYLNWKSTKFPPRILS